MNEYAFVRYEFRDYTNGKIYSGIEEIAKALNVSCPTVRKHIRRSDGDEIDIKGHRIKFALQKVQNPRAVPCVCMESGEIFDSASHASKVMGIHVDLIRRNLRGESSHTHRYHFRKIRKEKELMI